MLRFYLGEEKFYVSISGENFTKLVDTMKKFGGKFKTSAVDSDSQPLVKVWELDLCINSDFIQDILSIEPETAIPEFLTKFSSEKDLDFKKFRACINPSYVKGNFKGEYQKRAILKGISQNRLAIFHEMGLGKSFEIQTILNHLMGWNKITKYVIVSPPEGILNLKRECLKFNTFGLRPEDFYIVDTEHRNPFTEEAKNKKVILMTYRNLIMLQDDFYKKRYKDKKPPSKIMKIYIPWNELGENLALVLDESPAIKNPDSKTFKIINKSKKFFEFRYILTGTPAPKYSKDLWTQFKFLQDTCVPDFLVFLRSIASVGSRFSSTDVNYYYPDKVEAFLERISYLVDRETLASSGVELPELIIDPVFCKIPEKQFSIYKNIVLKTISVLKEKDGKLTRKALQNKYSYLSLALHDPTILLNGSLDEQGTDSELLNLLKNWKITENGKFEIAKALIEKNIAEQKKTILWSGHPLIIDLLAEKFSSMKPYTLHAGTITTRGNSVAERNDEIVEAFKKDKDSWLLIANYLCLKTSVNIVEAPRQIYWDRSWDAEAFAQSVKRSHRIGQTETVVVQPLIFENSLEEEQDKELSSRLEFNSKIWTKNLTSEKEELKDEVLSLNECRRIFIGE